LDADCGRDALGSAGAGELRCYCGKMLPRQ
jgi:hypothetical protein